ncbi:MAG: phosphoadenosine phosphosulfate reductase family protein [Candidatus Odinarchaeota archaeon]
MGVFDKDLFGKSKYDISIEYLQVFMPREGYYVAFSGGKDSIVLKKLAKLAKVKYDIHHSHTTVDAPELIYYIRQYHKDVKINYSDTTMWKLIPKKKMPPTRIVRYCCSELKEEGGIGRFVMTGVRWDESSKRKNIRKLVEFDAYGSQSKAAKENRQIFLNSDNDAKRKMIETCVVKGKHIINPIVNWTTEDVWEFIHYFELPYCELYDEGFDRIGCVGCPMQGCKGMERDFERWPKYKDNYIRAFDRMLIERKKAGIDKGWKNGEEVFDWWLYGGGSEGELTPLEKMIMEAS